MTYADPTRCPGCATQIAYGAARCDACGLSLSGPTAQQLFVALAEADRLIAELRSGVPTPPAPPAAPAAPNASEPVTTPLPAPPALQPRARSSRPRSSASVPQILLTLGVLCLSIAAIVFLAVTWSLLGVGGRTAVLVALTVLSGVLSMWLLPSRGLRGATEAVSLLTFLLLVLDLLGADNAGWLGDPPGRLMLAIVAIVLVVVATLTALLIRSRFRMTLIGVQVVPAVGLILGTISLALDEWSVTPGRLVVATVVAAAVAAGHWLLRMQEAAFADAVVTLGVWSALLMTAVVEMLDDPTLSTLWGDFEAWPGIAAAALAAITVPVTQLPLPIRQGAASLATAAGAITLSIAAWDESPTAASLTAMTVLAVAAAGMWLIPQPAVAATYVTSLGSASVTAVISFVLSALSLQHLGDAGFRPGAFDDRLNTVEGDWPAPWLLPLGVAALGFAALGLARLVDSPPLKTWLRSAVPAAVVGGAALMVAGYDVHVWVAMAVLLLVGAGYAAWGLTLSAVLALLAAALTSFHDFGLAAISFGFCVALVVVGALLRRAAPLVSGATTAGVIAIRYAAPEVAEHVHPWIVFGVAGALLIAMGITWEARLRDLRRFNGYVRGLG